jgi:outer membrane protein OmpA-like peptidoglycan-associated protein
MRFTRLHKVLLAIPFAAACATAQTGTSRELVEARAAYARAATGPATTEAPGALENARRTLIAAERINRDDPRSTAERHMAYVARQRAELAIAKAETRRAERAAHLARVQLQRNADEAARAAEAAKARAEAVTKQLEHETQQRAVAERDASTTRTDLARLEMELEYTRKQLSDKGDQLGEQTRQLKDREVALQTQVDLLRAEHDRAEQLRKERDQALTTLRSFANIEEDERGVVITVPSEVMFRTGSAKLLPRAKEKLDEVAVALGKLGTEQTFVIEGHTDSRGSAAANARLSKRRADAVRSYLVEQGVDEDRVIARGRGEAVPVASNTDAEGRASNRRVEIVVTPQTIEL